MESYESEQQATRALWNYGVVIAFSAVSFALLKLKGDPVELILLKVAVVPLFFLAINGLRSTYGQFVAGDEFTGRAMEYFLLKSLIFTLLLFVFLWEPGTILKDLFGMFFVSLVSFNTAMLAKAYFAFKATSDDR